MNSLSIEPLTLTFKIRYSEVDQFNRLKMSAVFLLMQEMAATHATEYQFGYQELATANKFWVLSRVHVVLNHFPANGDLIKITTWPKGLDRLFALRDFRFYDMSDNEIGKATTSWLVIDKNTHRPLTPDFLNQINYPEVEPAFEKTAPKIPLSNNLSLLHSQTAHWSDIDINQHVNNTRYIDWILDSLSPTEYQYSQIALEVNFNAEMSVNDCIEMHRNKFNEPSIHIEGRINNKNIVSAQIQKIV
jgi:medium-chain acyl-[acyl-carrier-protein] hydrolase